MRKILFLIIVLSFSLSVVAQLDKQTIKLLRQVENSYKNKLYHSSLSLLVEVPNNKLAIISYWKGKNLLSLSQYCKAQAELQKVVDKGTVHYSNQKNAVPFDAYILLSDAERRQNLLDSALDVLYKAKIRSKENQLWQDRIAQEIAICTKAIELQKIKLKSKPLLKKEWSDRHNETSILVSADGHRKIYYSEREINSKIENKAHSKNIILPKLPKLAVITGLSSDAKKILYTDKGDIYIQEFRDSKWQKSTKLPFPINLKSEERDAVFSADARTIFFSSNRKNSYGGFDLYKISRNSDNVWGELIHLNKKVNTIDDEISPYFHYDMKTLYFSSNNKNTMGGFDIYNTSLDEEGHFSAVKNVGFPINSTSDDFGFKLQPNGADAYFLSNRPNGLGRNDIYYVNIVPENEEDNLVLMIGTAKFSDEAPIKNVQISISNKETDEIIGVFLPNQVTGKFLFLLPPGKNYSALYEARGYLSYINDFMVSQDSAYYKIRHGVEMDPVVFYNPPSMLINSKTIIHDIFFEANSADIKDSYKKELNNLATYLKKNPNAIIEIDAFSDNQNSDAFNLKLTQKRAEKARTYILNKGVNKNQVIAKGYGEASAIAVNSTPEGRKYNRRIEFVIKQKGHQDIEIQKIYVPKRLKIIK